MVVYNLYVYGFYTIIIFMWECIVQGTGCVDDGDGDNDYGDSGDSVVRANSKTTTTTGRYIGRPFVDGDKIK